MRIGTYRFLVLVAAWILLPVTAVADQVTPSGHGQSSRSWVIGFAQDTMGNDWRAAQVRKLELAFNAYPGIRFIYTDARGNTARQIADFEDLAARGVDLIITSPRDGKAMAPAIARIHRKGIPVILLTRTANTREYTTMIGPDDRQISARAAQYMVKQLNEKGRILVLKGVPTATTAIQRTEGFMREIRKHKGIKVVAVRTANYLRGDAIKAVEDIITKGIRFDAIFAQSDSMASGARLALTRAGIDPRKIVIVGIDYIPEARQAIRDGTQSASFTYPVSSDAAARAANQILTGQKVSRRIVIESIMVTRGNVDTVDTIF